MNIEKIATLKVEPVPIEYGIDCLVCGAFIPMTRYPKICDECKRRLMRMLYPNRREGE